MALGRRKVTKATLEEIRAPRFALECGCGVLVEDVSHGVKTVYCWRCTAKLVDPPAFTSKPKPDEERPRGWHLKKRYVSPSGKVYQFGREVDESVPHIQGKTKATPDRTGTAGRSNTARKGRRDTDGNGKSGRKRGRRKGKS